MYRDSTDKSLIVCKAFAENHHALVRDLIFANILGMISASHLDYDHDLAKLAVDGYVAIKDSARMERKRVFGRTRSHPL